MLYDLFFQFILVNVVHRQFHFYINIMDLKVKYFSYIHICFPPKRRKTFLLFNNLYIMCRGQVLYSWLSLLLLWCKSWVIRIAKINALFSTMIIFWLLIKMVGITFVKLANGENFWWPLILRLQEYFSLRCKVFNDDEVRGSYSFRKHHLKKKQMLS